MVGWTNEVEERPIGRMDEQINGRLDEQRDVRTDERTNRPTLTNGRTHELTSGRRDQQTNARTDERTKEWKQGRTHGPTYVFDLFVIVQIRQCSLYALANSQASIAHARMQTKDMYAYNKLFHP